MTLFTIETSTHVCSAAWCIDQKCVSSRVLADGESNHAALVPQFIQELLAEGQHNGWVADAVAVSAGPGSYTGLRIGLSTAKGLCYGWNVPLIPIPTLDILCQVAQEKYPSMQGTLLPMLDARRMEVYTIVNGQTIAQVVEDVAWLPQDTPIYYFGDGAAKCQHILCGDRFHFIDGIQPLASAMGAAYIQHHYSMIGEKELAYYTPFYLKDFVAAPSHVKGLQ